MNKHKKFSSPWCYEVIKKAGEEARQVGIPRSSNLTGLISDVRHIPKHYLDNAADIGTRVHARIEEYFTHGNDPVAEQEDEVGAVDAFARWWRGQRPHYRHHKLYPEVHIGNPFHPYRGTVDLLAIRSNKNGTHVTVFDWKTAGSLYPHYPVQIALYARAVESSLMKAGVKNIEISGKIVRLPKDGSEAELMEYDFDDAAALGLSCLDVYEFKYQHDSRFRKDIERNHKYDLFGVWEPENNGAAEPRDPRSPVVEPYKITNEDGSTEWGFQSPSKLETGTTVWVVGKHGNGFPRVVGNYHGEHMWRGGLWHSYREVRKRD